MNPRGNKANFMLRDFARELLNEVKAKSVWRVVNYRTISINPKFAPREELGGQAAFCVFFRVLHVVSYKSECSRLLLSVM